MKKSVIILSVLLLAVAFASAQWTEPVRISEPGGCLYPQILARGDTLHVVYSNSSGGTKISYVRSGDGGINWSEHSVLSDTLNTNDTQFPRILESGFNLMVIWRAYFTSGVRRLNLGYSISSNNGLTWSAPSYILDPNWDHILYFSASGSGPVVNVMFTSRINHELIFFNVRSMNFGQSWSEPAEIFRAESESREDQTSYGDIVLYAWSGRFDSYNNFETYLIRSTDAGISWGDNIMISDDDQIISQAPALYADERGNIAYTWWDFKYSPYQTTGDVLIKQSYDGGVIWGTEGLVTSQHKATLSRVVWGGDSLFVVWQDNRFGNPTIYYASSPDSIHNWSNKVRLEEDSAESNYPALAASNEKIYVVWADDRCDPDTNICGGIYFTRLDNQVGIQEDEMTILPDESSLGVYPNPFNSTTIITYRNLKGGEIEIYNINGQKIITFKTAEIKEGQIEWDARDALGNKVSSGIYFARAKGGGNNATIKLLYLR